MAIMPSIELKGAKFIVVYIALLLCNKATGHPSSSCAYYFTVAKKKNFYGKFLLFMLLLDRDTVRT